jgi:hypothetical protein
MDKVQKPRNSECMQVVTFTLCYLLAVIRFISVNYVPTHAAVVKESMWPFRIIKMLHSLTNGKRRSNLDSDTAPSLDSIDYLP